MDSGLLEFKDWIEIELIDSNGSPIVNAKYDILLPDGSELSGNLNSEGKAYIEDIPPGKFWINYPDYKDAF